MRKQAKLLANFLGATKELTSDEADNAKVLRQMREFFQPYEGLIMLANAENRRRPKSADEPLMVYAIRDEHGHVKIGHTRNLKARHTALQTGSSSRLEIIWSAEGGADDEKRMHQQFRGRLIGGEWFDFSDCSGQEIVRMCHAETKNINKSNTMVSQSDTGGQQ